MGMGMDLASYDSAGLELQSVPFLVGVGILVLDRRPLNSLVESALHAD